MGKRTYRGFDAPNNYRGGIILAENDWRSSWGSLANSFRRGVISGKQVGSAIKTLPSLIENIRTKRVIGGMLRGHKTFQSKGSFNYDVYALGEKLEKRG